MFESYFVLYMKIQIEMSIFFIQSDKKSFKKGFTFSHASNPRLRTDFVLTIKETLSSSVLFSRASDDFPITVISELL